MNTPLLVRTYDNGRSSPSMTRRPREEHTLPPIASFTFAEILKSTDSPGFQSAIDGIAEICAKNRMSMADEYASHLPPLGEITATTTAGARPHPPRTGMRRALTSVPEASSGSSEGNGRSRERKGSFFSFRRRGLESGTTKTMRIGSMGRAVPVDTTTALTSQLLDSPAWSDETNGRSSSQSGLINDGSRRMTPERGNSSRAVCSLQRLQLETRHINEPQSSAPR